MKDKYRHGFVSQIVFVKFDDRFRANNVRGVVLEGSRGS